jgi:hypothetical protein
MTVGITVAIRFGEGEDQVVSRYRDLYRLPAFIQYPAFIEGAWGYFRDYALEPSPFEGKKDCAPQDAGIVAIDLPSRQILMYEDRGLVFSAPYDITDAHKGIGPHPSSWETRAAWTTLMAEGRVSLKVQWERPLPRDEADALRQVAAGPYVQGIGPYPGPGKRSLSIYRLPYSLEPLHTLEQAAARIHELESLGIPRFKGPYVELRPYPQTVRVDLAPWTIHRFSMSRAGDERLRRAMARIGFPECGPSAPGWSRWAKEVVRNPRDRSEHALRKRAEARAPLVASPF